MISLMDEMDSCKNTMTRMANEMALIAKAQSLLEGVDFSDVQYVSVYSDSGRCQSIRFTLDSEHADSKLVHVLAQALGVTFEKKPSFWYGDNLEASAIAHGIQWTVAGYVPSTCHIEEIKTPMTAEEIEKAKAVALNNVRTVKTTRKIVCK